MRDKPTGNVTQNGLQVDRDYGERVFLKLTL